MAEGKDNFMKSDFNKAQDNRLAGNAGRTSAADVAAEAAGAAGNAYQGVREELAKQAEAAAEQVRRTRDDVREKAADAYGRASDAYEDAADWAKDKVKEKVEHASSWASDAYEEGADRLHRARERSGRQFDRARNGMQDYAAQNPVVIGLVGLAAGLLLGALLPRTRREDRAFGEFADEARQHGLRYAKDMTRRGREFVEEAFTGDDPRYRRHASEYDRGPSAERH